MAAVLRVPMRLKVHDLGWHHKLALVRILCAINKERFERLLIKISVIYVALQFGTLSERHIHQATPFNVRAAAKW